MAWYNPWASKKVEEKLNPAQPYFDEPRGQSIEPTIRYEKAYEELEIVNRAVNMLVDDAAAIPFQVGENLPIYSGGGSQVRGVKAVSVERLLNRQPNPYQDVNSFKRNLIIDLIMDGNCFIYWDGRHLYHLPATKVSIVQSETTYISHYMFQERVRFETNEIIHIKDNSFYSIYRGVSRLRPALRSINLMRRMRNFQDNFFKNGAVPGLVIKSENTLSERVKERLLASWSARYNPESGGRRPMILDGGVDVKALNDVNFKELDFQDAIIDSEKLILKSLGIPPILLDGGNNANIRPNTRLYYLETIIPIVHKFVSAYERFFGFEISEDVTHVQALQPELNEQSDYYATLTNSGIVTANEARRNLGFEPIEGHDDLRIPANIAGSAANPSEGGRPTEGEDDSQ